MRGARKIAVEPTNLPAVKEIMQRIFFFSRLISEHPTAIR